MRELRVGVERAFKRLEVLRLHEFKNPALKLVPQECLFKPLERVG